jgi:dethiobiotin synthetase
MKSVFITGTDTGIGKTVFAAALLAAARARGIDAVPMKPVQTGCVRRGRRILAPDLEFCLSAADLNPAPQERHWMCPYRFMLASSPHLAAARAGAHIQKETIRSNFRRILKKYDTAIVEGAGGVLVPIDAKNTMLDIMKALRLPVILVARAGLGTINHTLLSIAELRRAKLRVIGIVVVQSVPGKKGLIEKDNIRTIERIGRTPVLACLPFRNNVNSRAFALLLSRVFQALEK